MAARKPQARATPPSSRVNWLAQHPVALLVLATLLALLPFIGKPFNIDDPLFIWVAQHIRFHPLDPYGFNVNWYGHEMALWEVTKNPPLACYYLALVGSVFGWSEIALHSAMLLPAIAVVLGTYRLAARFCKQPLWAALLTLFTPVFLVSSTTIMCDVMMLAFWVWAVVFWVEGTEQKRPGPFAVSALLMTLAALTKYFGACVIPLVVVWSLGSKRPLKEWLGWLAVPVVGLVAYQLATRNLYGHGLLADAGEYATGYRRTTVLLNVQSLLNALAFTGGGLAVAVFFAPVIWDWRRLLPGAIASVALAGILFLFVSGSYTDEPGAGEIIQILFWSAGAIGFIALAVTDLWRRRDPASWLLMCWVLGTFIFTAFFNWVVNGRSILPLVIPVCILVARRLEQRANSGAKVSAGVVAFGAVLAIWVGAADYGFATAAKTTARAVCSAYANGNQRLWFQGHWGFQYYMEKEGATALNLHRLQLTQGDHIAMPSNNSNVFPLDEPVAELKTFSVPRGGWLATMNAKSGAGFYASMWGPLPFAFGRPSPMIATVFAYDPSGDIQKTNATTGQPGSAGVPPAR
jgi:hypothetical protein